MNGFKGVAIKKCSAQNRIEKSFVTFHIQWLRLSTSFRFFFENLFNAYRNITKNKRTNTFQMVAQTVFPFSFLIVEIVDLKFLNKYCRFYCRYFAGSWLNLKWHQFQKLLQVSANANVHGGKRKRCTGKWILSVFVKIHYFLNVHYVGLIRVSLNDEMLC